MDEEQREREPVPQQPDVAAAAAIAAVAFRHRLPPFWRERPRLWFAQIDAVLEPQHQSDQAKFQTVVSLLERADLELVSDLLLNPPARERYQALKDRLITAYEESAARQFHRLIDQVDSTEAKPSHLLRKMKELAQASQLPDNTVKMLWIGRLPPTIRAVVSANQQLPVDALATMADTVSEYLPSAGVMAVTADKLDSTPTTTKTPIQETTSIKDEIAALRADIAALRLSRRDEYTRDSRGYESQRSRGRYRSTSSNRTRSESPDGPCYFHRRFGADAWKCGQPCNYAIKQSQNSSISRNATN